MVNYNTNEFLLWPPDAFDQYVRENGFESTKEAAIAFLHTLAAHHAGAPKWSPEYIVAYADEFQLDLEGGFSSIDATGVGAA